MGYDNATGLGSFNGANLYATLIGSFQPPAPIPPPPAPTPPSPTPAPIPGGPSYRATLKHTSPFAKGEVGTYSMVVSNVGSSPTSGSTFIAVTLPEGLTYNSSRGLGWVTDGKTMIFEQTKILKPGESYPTLVLKVNVAKNAPDSVVTLAIASGGGADYVVMQDPTTLK